MRGIDVSSWQGAIDWPQVKNAGVEFAVIKAIRRDLNPDNQFEANWSGCKANDIRIMGVYNYIYATGVEEAIKVAKALVDILGDRKTTVWMDIEDDSLRGLGQTLVDIINAYRDVIVAAGHSFGVYTGLSFYGSYIRPYAAQIDCPFWIARYPSTETMELSDNPNPDKKPEIDHPLAGWQYTSSGVIPGIDGAVDFDEFYEDISEQTGNTDKEDDELGDVNICYMAYTDRWWPEVHNREDWAGKGDNHGIKGIMMRVDKGYVKYRVHLKGSKWLPWVTGYSEDDYNNGFAGDLVHDIDAIEAVYYTPEGYDYKYLHYMVSAFNTPHYYPEQIDNSTEDGMDGYAGVFGRSIDKVQMWVE